MTDVEIRESEDLVLPNGTVVSLNDPTECARALNDLRALRRLIDEVAPILNDRLAEESRRLGSRTVSYGDLTAETKKGRVRWDVQALEEGLRAAGCPEERIEEIIYHEITPKVRAVEANRAARANEEYAAVIEACRAEEKATVYVSESRR